MQWSRKSQPESWMPSNTNFLAEPTFKFPTNLVKKVCCRDWMRDSRVGIPDSMRTSLFGVLDLTPKQHLIREKQIVSSCFGTFDPKVSQLCKSDDATHASRTLSFTGIGASLFALMKLKNLWTATYRFNAWLLFYICIQYAPKTN